MQVIRRRRCRGTADRSRLHLLAPAVAVLEVNLRIRTVGPDVCLCLVGPAEKSEARTLLDFHHDQWTDPQRLPEGRDTDDERDGCDNRDHAGKCRRISARHPEEQ
jgi:hypothetical protein